MGGVLGLFPFLNGLNLLGVHLDSFVADYESEVFCFFLQELTLAEFGIQLILSEDFQNFSKVLQVLFDVTTVDENIIQVDEHAHIQFLSEDIIHQSLEGYWGIDETEV